MSSDALFRIILSILALAGLGTCLIFAYHWLNNREAEVTCADGTGIKLSKTPYARVFWGIPHWLFGIAYYLITLLAAIVANAPLLALTLIGAVLSTILSLYLVFGLSARLKAVCPLCYVAHSINFALLSMWIIIVAIGK